MHKVDANLVRSIHLFSKLAVMHLSRLVASASLRHVAARILLFAEDDDPAILYTLMHGSVELFSEHHDRQYTIEVIRPAKTFLLSSIVKERNPMSARTLDRCELLVLPAKLVHELINVDAKFAATVARELADEYHNVIEMFKNQKMRTTMERVAQWILRCDDDSGCRGQFVIPYDKRVLASYLGMTPENLSRTLAALAAAGVVVDGRRVALNDRPALFAAAGSNPPESVRDLTQLDKIRDHGPICANEWVPDEK